MEHNNTLGTYETRVFCPEGKGILSSIKNKMKGIVSTHAGHFARVCEGDFVRSLFLCSHHNILL
jgi:hypothetical protein